MERIEHEITNALAESPDATPFKLLIVGDTTGTATAQLDAWDVSGCNLTAVTTLADARSAIARTQFDLLLVESNLPDGDGLSLSSFAQRACPHTKTIVMSRDDSADSAIRAVRSGAVDVLRMPNDLPVLTDRIASAIDVSRRERQRDQRLFRLKTICTELNTARREISDQVDSLCNELVTAYQETNEQIDAIRMATEFRTMLRQELDVEELLRTMLEYMLVKTGPTNAAVFLPDTADTYGLGAYVNYDCPRDSITFLLDQLSQTVCPQMADEPDIVSFRDAREFAEWIDLDLSFLEKTNIVAFSCHHGGECLAIVVLFRSRNDPFVEELAPVLDTLRMIFAEQLANVINIHHRARPSWPTDMHDETDDADDWYEDGMAA